MSIVENEEYNLMEPLEDNTPDPLADILMPEPSGGAMVGSTVSGGDDGGDIVFPT